MHILQRFRITAILITLTLLAGTPVAADGTAALTSVKKLVGFIRYEKNDKALEQVGLDAISEFLMGSYYTKATPEQKSRVSDLMGEYIELQAFPLALKYFKDIDLAYDEPKEQGKDVHIRSTLLYAGSERVVFTWVLTEVGGEWVVTDFLDERGVSSMKASRDKQIQPVLKKSGVDGLIAQLEKVVAKLREQ